MHSIAIIVIYFVARTRIYNNSVVITITFILCISMAIAKTASRNVAFKVAKMREAIMEDQELIYNTTVKSLGPARSKDTLERARSRSGTPFSKAIMVSLSSTLSIRNSSA